MLTRYSLAPHENDDDGGEWALGLAHKRVLRVFGVVPKTAMTMKMKMSSTMNQKRPSSPPK